MITKRRGSFLTAALAAVLSLTALACTDGVVNSGENNTDENNARPNTNNVNPTPPENSRLVHLDQGPQCNSMKLQCLDDITINSGRRLEVQLLDADDAPVANTEVNFDISGGDIQSAVNLMAGSAVTDSDGIAQTFLNTTDEQGTVRVSVTTNDTNVSAVEFLLTVTTKSASSYNIDFTEVGQIDPRDLEVYLYPEDTLCESFLNDYRSLQAEKSANGEASASGDYPTVQVAPVTNGTAYTVGVLAYDRSNPDVLVGMGCTPSSDDTRLEDGQPVTVNVPVIQTLPVMVDNSFDIIISFDLVDALPPTVRTIVDLLGTIASDPGAFFIGCGDEDPQSGELMSTADCPVPTEGVVNLLVGFLPDDGTLGDLKESIEGFLSSTFTQQVVRNTINDLINDFLMNNDNVPDWVGDSLTVTQDIYATLQDFRVEATLRIKEQPTYIRDSGDNTDITALPLEDEQGRLIAEWGEGANEHIWENILFQWRGGCEEPAPPNCGESVPLAPSTFSTSMGVVEGRWSGRLIGGNLLEIDEHSLTLNYGALLLAVIEQVALPRLFNDPQVNSVEAVLDLFVDCQKLADDVGVGAIEALCGQLKQQASDALRDYAASLILDGDGRFVIGTTEGQPCQLKGPSAYTGRWSDSYPAPYTGKPFPYVEKMGEDDPVNERCAMTAKISFNEAGTTSTQLDGTFSGTR